jgi:hypothetical protein
VFTLSTADITELKWSYNGETAALSYNGSKWSCADDSSFPLSQDLVKSMAASLADIKAVKTISSPDALSEYGLDEPVCDVTVKTDAEHEIKLGSETSLGGQYYISIGDGKVYIVPDSTLLDMFSRGLYDVIETESLPDMSDITAFAIKSGAGELSLVHKTGSGYTYSDNYEWFVSDGGSYTALDTSAVQELTGQITGLVWQKCVDYNAADRLASYGLASPAATVTVSYKDSDGAAASFVLEMGNSTDSGCYARISGSGHDISGRFRRQERRAGRQRLRASPQRDNLHGLERRYRLRRDHRRQDPHRDRHSGDGRRHLQAGRQYRLH